MKIKTITCHEVYNHGASLQEYALLKFLNNQGHEAKVIHYKPPYLSGHFNLKAVSNPKFNKPLLKQLYLLAKLPRRLRSLKRKRAFDEFHQRYIPSDTKLYRNNEELKRLLPEADAYICGSDQIWNSYFENGKDPAFYLNFAPDDVKKISYAASFAIKKLTEEIKPLVYDNVSKLDAVGVRETSGVNILENLGIYGAQQVLDPVFLLDKEHWSQFIYLIKEKFIFVYDFDSNPLIKKIALELKHKNEWRIYTVNQNIDYADKNFFIKGPETFLSLVTQSRINLTNSFHAVAFSILFEKELRVFNRSERINTRMQDLLSLFGLENYLINSEEKINNIVYRDIKVLKKAAIKKSKKFLITALK